jgi:hypothetical protein
MALIAQQPMATLEHAGTTKVFYGEGSFVQAYNASVNGDQIYLSGGTFYPPTSIAKGIKVTGAGHSPSDSLHIQTFIKGLLNINEGADSLRLEGLSIGNEFKNNYYCSAFFDATNPVNYVKILRCSMNTVLFNSASKNNCSIEECFVNGNILFSYYGNNLLIRNSLITGQIWSISGNALIDGNIFLYSNSNSSYTFDGVNYSIIQNNIFLGSSYTFRNSDNSKGNALNNNIFVTAPIYYPGTSNNNYIQIALTNIFMNYSSNSNIYINDYHLKKPQTYIGTDGTQVGLYGGLGFKEKGFPSNPQIISKTIAPRTDGQGNLKINITVKAQDN